MAQDCKQAWREKVSTGRALCALVLELSMAFPASDLPLLPSSQHENKLSQTDLAGLPHRAWCSRIGRTRGSRNLVEDAKRHTHTHTQMSTATQSGQGEGHASQSGTGVVEIQVTLRWLRKSRLQSSCLRRQGPSWLQNLETNKLLGMQLTLSGLSGGWACWTDFGVWVLWLKLGKF